MINEYRGAIIRAFEPSGSWQARSTKHDRPSGFERERRGLFRRGTWIRGVLLSADHSRAGGVPVALSAIAGCADVERLRESIQGLLGNGTVADWLFCVARGESRIRALEVLDDPTLGPGVGSYRLDDRQRSTDFSHRSRRVF